jgi:FlaA1/EpsC-like NDP-sugar epimerase
LLICGVSVWLSFGLQLDQWTFFYDKHWLVFISATSFSLPIFIAFGLYRAIFRYIGTAAFLSIVRAFTFYTVIFFCTFTIFGVDGVPRTIGAIQPILLFIGISISRFFIRYWLGDNNNFKKIFNRAKPIALIYGAGSSGRQLAIGLSNNNAIFVRGFIDDDLNLVGSAINGLPIYPSNSLANLIARYGITDILLAIPSVNQTRRKEIIASLNGCGVRVRTVPDLFDLA